MLNRPLKVFDYIFTLLDAIGGESLYTDLVKIRLLQKSKKLASKEHRTGDRTTTSRMHHEQHFRGRRFYKCCKRNGSEVDQCRRTYLLLRKANQRISANLSEEGRATLLYREALAQGDIDRTVFDQARTH